MTKDDPGVVAVALDVGYAFFLTNLVGDGIEIEDSMVRVLGGWPHVRLVLLQNEPPRELPGADLLRSVKSRAPAATMVVVDRHLREADHQCSGKNERGREDMREGFPRPSRDERCEHDSSYRREQISRPQVCREAEGKTGDEVSRFRCSEESQHPDARCEERREV